MFKNYKLENLNIRLIFLVLTITILGIFVIGSAKESSQMTQIYGLLIGLVVMSVFALIDYRLILKFQWVMYLAMIILLILVFISGNTVNGSTRWIVIPGIGFQFQPSELVKILMILFFAKYYQNHEDDMHKTKTVLIAVLLVLPILFLIYKQPDLSTTICLAMLFCFMIFLAGINYKWVLAAFAVVIPVGVVLFSIILSQDTQLLEGYQLTRILAWLYPDKYPAYAYQQQNSIMAIGSGQLAGKGLNNNVIASVKNGNFIAEPQTDFIFAVAGEELGFIGTCAIIILLFLIVFELFNAARKSRDFSGTIICGGLGCLIGFQSFLNISVATGLMPNTGIPLPFVSYGLTSLVSMFIGIGVALNVQLQGDNGFWHSDSDDYI